MASINLTYKGLTGIRGTVIVDDSITIDDLITAIAADEGLDTQYYYISLERDHSVNDVDYGDSSATIASLGIEDGDYILCATKQFGTKEEKQIEKLEIAQRKRSGGPADDSSVDYPYYRPLNTYDRNKLPAKYVGNDATDSNNTLVSGRPWN